MLRVGIIGCGNILDMHAIPIMHQNNAILVGVCDIKKDRADSAAAKYNTTAYYDYRQFIDSAGLDIVHLCVPHYLHHIIAKYALNSGINVLSEKPMSIKLEDAIATVQLAKRNKLQYGVIFQCRYNNSAQLVKKCLDSGKLGKVISARVVLTWSRSDDYYSQSDWKGTWDKEGGGVVIDQAIHSLDLANWFINDNILKVQANIYNRHHKVMTVEDTAEGLIDYDGGATLGFWVMNNYGCNDDIEIRLYCECGKVVMNYDFATITLSGGEVLNAVPDKNDIEYENNKDYWGYQHIKQIRQFYKAVCGEEKLEISGEEALKTQKLICEIYKNGNFKKICE